MKHLILIFFCLTIAFAKAQQTDILDVERITADLIPDFEQKTISGTLNVEFKILKATDSIYLDAKDLSRHQVTFKNLKSKSHFDGEHLLIYAPFKANQEYSTAIEYTAKPKQALYFVDNLGSDQLWTQGQGKYTSHWLPSIDDMNDKIEFDLSVTAPSDKEVMANGMLTDKKARGSQTRWTFNMQNPMSSYLVALAIGDYKVKEVKSASGISLYEYYYPKDSALVEPTYRHMKQFFDFLETEIGIPFPWQNYKQVPVKDFLYAGMENTSLTIFSDAFMVDSTGFVDRNYVNVNAHELAHQWFGDLVTETSGTHHWLQEGFATYYALLAEREIFGDDYYYWKLYETAEQLKELSDTGKGEKLLNPKASSLTFYQKGAWALHILREQIGDTAFKQAVATYLEQNKFKNVTTDDFLAAAKASSGQDLETWRKDWLEQSAFQAMQVLESLKKSKFINEFLSLSALRRQGFEGKKDALAKAISSPSEWLGQEAVQQLAETTFDRSRSLYEQALASGNRWTRQAVALSLQQIPQEFEPSFATLLMDDSYVAQEAALLTLWVSFPWSRKKYLTSMKGIQGFSDKNIELLWLALSIATLDYEPETKTTRYQKLIGYTDSKQPFQIRENAFEYLYQLHLYEKESLTNLVLGCVHFNWRFAQSSRGILDMLLKEAMWLNALRDLKIDDARAMKYLTKKLKA